MLNKVGGLGPVEVIAAPEVGGGVILSGSGIRRRRIDGITNKERPVLGSLAKHGGMIWELVGDRGEISGIRSGGRSVDFPSDFTLASAGGTSDSCHGALIFGSAKFVAYHSRISLAQCERRRGDHIEVYIDDYTAADGPHSDLSRWVRRETSDSLHFGRPLAIPRYYACIPIDSIFESAGSEGRIDTLVSSIRGRS